MNPAERAAAVAEIIRVLHTWGIHSLGQFVALDKQDLGARFGPLVIELWERVSGKSARVLQRVAPVEIFEEQFEFENEIETAEPLLFMLRRFLQQFAVRLGATYLVAKELTLRITFSDKTAYEHTFKIPQPTNDVELLFRMLHTHLENFRSAAPIIAVSLQAEPAKPAQQQFGLFETALRDPAQLAETLARLTALVGSDRVGTPAILDTHEPDRFRIELFKWELPEPKSNATRPIGIALRRFRSAGEAVVLVEDNKPVHLRSAEIHGRVLEQNGPFLSSGNWWDEHAWRRAEWDAELEHGALCRCHSEGERWRVDGIYD